MSLTDAIIIAIVEGITEFLPISSTGHMIITEHLLGTAQTESEKSFVTLFTVAIQLGAILAVVVLYWKKFVDFKRWQFYAKLAVGVIPALVLGYFFSEQIDEWLFNPTVVAIALLAGGFVLLVIDRVFTRHTVEKEEQLGFGKSFLIGCWQVISMIPGVSRSAASIIGGMQQQLTRNLAAEFSFFLAVPTMFAATAYSLFIKEWKGDNGTLQKGIDLVTGSKENTMAFIVGNAVAFIIAMLAIRFFIGFLQKHGFRLFGFYRILAGLVLLILIFSGVLEG